MKKLQKTLPGKKMSEPAPQPARKGFEDVFAYALTVCNLDPVESCRYATAVCCDWPQRYKRAAYDLMDLKPIDDFKVREVTVQATREIFHSKNDLETLELMLMLEKNPQAWQYIFANQRI